jgi:hypothetical protein
VDFRVGDEVVAAVRVIVLICVAVHVLIHEAGLDVHVATKRPIDATGHGRSRQQKRPPDDGRAYQ